VSRRLSGDVSPWTNLRQLPSQVHRIPARRFWETMATVGGCTWRGVAAIRRASLAVGEAALPRSTVEREIEVGEE